MRKVSDNRLFEILQQVCKMQQTDGCRTQSVKYNRVHTIAGKRRQHFKILDGNWFHHTERPWLIGWNTWFARSELWVRIPEKSMVVAGRRSITAELQQILPVNRGANSMTPNSQGTIMWEYNWNQIWSKIFFIGSHNQLSTNRPQIKWVQKKITLWMASFK